MRAASSTRHEQSVRECLAGSGTETIEITSYNLTRNLYLERDRVVYVGRKIAPADFIQALPLARARLQRRRPSGFIEPCQPSKVARPAMVHEIKHDGYRLRCAGTARGSAASRAALMTGPTALRRPISQVAQLTRPKQEAA